MQTKGEYATLREISRGWQIPLSWLYARSRKDALPGLRRLGRHIRIDVREFEEGVRNGQLG